MEPNQNLLVLQSKDNITNRSIMLALYTDKSDLNYLTVSGKKNLVSLNLVCFIFLIIAHLIS